MDKYVITFIAVDIISLAVYSWIALANWRLSVRVEPFNGDSVIVLRLLAVLCAVVFLNDLFWLGVLVSPLVISEYVSTEAYRIIAVGVNVIMRAAPALILLRLWRYLVEKEED